MRSRPPRTPAAAGARQTVECGPPRSPPSGSVRAPRRGLAAQCLLLRGCAPAVARGGVSREGAQCPVERGPLSSQLCFKQLRPAALFRTFDSCQSDIL